MMATKRTGGRVVANEIATRIVKAAERSQSEGSCLTNTRPVSGSRASSHRSPVGTEVNLSRSNRHAELAYVITLTI